MSEMINKIITKNQRTTTINEKIIILSEYAKLNNGLSNIKYRDTFFYNGKEYRIGDWLHKLRIKYKKNLLTQDEIRQLEDIGILWEKLQYFDTRIEPLVAYFEKFGTIANIKHDEIFEYNSETVNIGIKVNNLRREFKEGILTKEQINVLNNLGMVWEHRKRYPLELKFEILKDYVNNGGSLLTIKLDEIYSYKEENFEIGKWVNYFRVAYNRNELKQETIDILESIGMVWKALCFKPIDERINILKGYVTENGSLKNILRYEKYVYEGKEYPVGLWISRFREAYNDNILSEYTIKELQKLGISWRKKLTFEEKLFILEQYKLKRGTIADIKAEEWVKHEGVKINIGTIIHHFRQYYKKGKLSNKQIELLEKLGMVWERTFSSNSQIIK